MIRLFAGLIALVCGLAQATPTLDCTASRHVETAERTVVRAGETLDKRIVSRLDPLERAWMREGTHIYYRIALDDCVRQLGQAVWVYRLGAPYRIRADGKALTPIQPFASASSLAFNGRVPALFELPVNAHELQIELVTLPYVQRGLIRIDIAPLDALVPSRSRDVAALTGFNDASSTVIVVVGLVVLSTWLLRRRDLALLWFGLACIVWATRGMVYQMFALPIDPLLMEQLNPLLVLWTCTCVAISALHSLNAARRRAVSGLLGTAITLTFCFAIAGWAGLGGGLVRSLAFGIAFAMMLGVIVRLFRQTVLSREQTWTMLAGFVALMAGAVHDMGMVVGWVTPDHWSYVTPGFTVMLLCYTVAVSRYLVRNLTRAEQSNEELEAVIRTKTAALETSYSLLREHDRENARSQERAHLLREMHDGLGAQLMTALRGVERGVMPREQVLQALQDSLDDLRLLMDSTDLGRTLAGALVAWRSRWSPRLATLGIDMQWHLDDGVESIQLAPDTVLQVMRIIQEATVNVVKHSQANQITLRTTKAQAALTIEVIDNGVGMTLEAPRNGARGLSNMRARAAMIMARLSVQASPDAGLTVQLCLPLSVQMPP